MRPSHRFVRSLGSLLLAFALTPSAFATAGFAEWEVYTPGGHMISHNDLWKERHGDCLRSEARPDAAEARIFVSHLERWRYYPGHIAGSSADGWFLFDETTETLSRFSDEGQLESALTDARLDRPVSPWLTGADGWREGWFPFMVWRPCRMLRDGEIERAVLSEAECRQAMTPEWMALYKKTTWGRLCEEWSRSGSPVDQQGFLEEFCEEIRTAGD